MKSGKYTILFSLLFLSFTHVHSQQTDWPKVFKTPSGNEIKLYEPQPQSYTGNTLKIRSAVSILQNDKADPTFGVLWADIKLDEAQNNNLVWQNFSLTDLKFPGEINQADLDELSSTVESEAPRLNVQVTRTELNDKISAAGKEESLAENISTRPPKIIYSKTPAVLVLVDGKPEFETNTAWGVEQVVNTPFTIVKSKDQQFYLYGERKWYAARSIEGPWNYIDRVPSALSKMEKDVRARDTSSLSRQSKAVPEIIVSHEPAELIQSEGEPNFAPLDGTDLLYMTNTGNDIFMDVNSQQYFVLISGRWYKAPNLASSWSYMASTDLPKDFSRIPEGSPKGIVLASIAGTTAASESVAEAQIPQTAKVDRKTAKASVMYDGDPQFEDIEGTSLRYAVNTNGAVLNEGRNYYYVENGVWFQSNSPNGPWIVSTQRPDEVQNIPPSYPVYNVKYVYIYDATPDFVYTGYTPGYLGTYIYGPTTVYGTGFYYRPWRGRHYFARPSTWGFNMRYDPWHGWSFGLNIFPGWFFPETRYYGRGYYNGGCWGPPVYRPPYYGYYDSYGYGRGGRGNYNRSGYYQHNNVYQYRRDVVTYNRPVYNTVYNNYYNTNGGRGGNRPRSNQTGVQRPARQANTSQSPGVTGQVNRPGRIAPGTRDERVITPRGTVDRNPVTRNGVIRPQGLPQRTSDERVAPPINSGTNRYPRTRNQLPGGEISAQDAATPRVTQPSNRDASPDPFANNNGPRTQRLPQGAERRVIRPANSEINRSPSTTDARPQGFPQRSETRSRDDNNRAPIIQPGSQPQRSANQRAYEPANNSRSRNFEGAQPRVYRPQSSASGNLPTGGNERVRAERPSFERSPSSGGAANSSRQPPQRPSRGRQSD